jgi:hypothetical protein
MTSIAKRTIATLAIVASLAVGAPVAALAGTTTSTTTTTVITKTPVITTYREWRSADRLYHAKLKVINVTFLAAVATAKLNLSSALGTATNSSERISARATFRFAITEATVARSNALTLLGNPPVKPDHKTVDTTTTF